MEPTEAAADAVDGLNPQEIASLYELIAESAGIFDAGKVTDNDGRTGVAIGFYGTPVGSPTGYSVTECLVLNSSTGQPLEHEEIASPASVLAPSLGNQPVVTQYVTLDIST